MPVTTTAASSIDRPNRAASDRRQPEVSVVIPTRNRHRLLALALASVLEQRDVDLEAIVIDEGSTDGTSVMVAHLGDPRVRLIRHDSPLGKSAARNRGIAEARGEWIGFLDDDDIWAPDKLRLQLNALSGSGRRWGYTGAINITEDHKVLGGAPPRPPDEVVAAIRRVNGVPGGCSSVIVRKNALPAEGFNESYRLCEDWDLWIRLAGVGVPACVASPLVGYRIHAGNSSVETDRLLAELDMIETRHGGPVDRLVFFRHLARVSLRANWQWRAFGYYVHALVHSPRYLFRGFVSDVVEVMRAMGNRVMARLGRPPHIHEPSSSSGPQRVWYDDARGWLREFARRHAS